MERVYFSPFSSDISPFRRRPLSSNGRDVAATINHQIRLFVFSKPSSFSRLSPLFVSARRNRHRLCPLCSQHIKKSIASLSSSFNPSFLSLSSLSGYAFTTTSAVPSSGNGVIAATSNITCFVNPSTGTVTNLQQSSKLACTAGGERVVIPSAGKYVTKMEMAVDKELPLVGRFVFHVRDTLESKPAVYTCGFAGGEAISLFPSGYIATSIDVGCIPLTPQAIGKRRRRLSLVAKNAANPELVQVFSLLGEVFGGGGRCFWRRNMFWAGDGGVVRGGRRFFRRRQRVCRSFVPLLYLFVRDRHGQMIIFFSLSFIFSP